MPEEKVSSANFRHPCEHGVHPDDCDVCSTPAADAGPRQPDECGEPAASFIPRWGMYFTCVLPKGHEGEHKQGGTCFKHGEYVGDKCPKWPDCSAPVPQEAAPRECDCEECASRLAPAPDWAMRAAEQIWDGDSEAQWQTPEDWIRSAAALIREAGSERERKLLLLAGRLCESQSPEWGDVDGATIEEWLLEAGLFKQIDVSEPCDPENCQCAEFGMDFPTKCNRRTELGKQAVAEASRLLGGER